MFGWDSQVQTDPDFVLSQWDKLKAAIVTIQVRSQYESREETDAILLKFVHFVAHKTCPPCALICIPPYPPLLPHFSAIRWRLLLLGAAVLYVVHKHASCVGWFVRGCPFGFILYIL